MPKAAATAATNAAMTMRNTARAITLPRQRAGRRAMGLVGFIAEFSAPYLSPPRLPNADDSGSYARRDGPAGRLRVLRPEKRRSYLRRFVSNLHHFVR